MTYRYFAYGSNLDAAHFAEWAREHDYAGRALGEGLVAALDDQALALTVASRYWMGGVGTLVPRHGAVTYGALFELDDGDADMIRHKEGVASGLYREIDVEVRVVGPVTDATIELYAAHTFVASAARSLTVPPPSRRWLEVVIRGARARDLPAAWISDLEARLVG